MIKRFGNGVFCLWFTLTLTGCATTKSFEPTTGKSLLVYADKIPSRGAAGNVFLPINLSSSKAKGEIFQTFTGSLQPAMFKGNDGTIKFFQSRQDEPGDYAMIGRGGTFRGADSIINGGVILGQGNIYFECFHKKAPVYSLRAAEITIIPMQDLGTSSAELLDLFSGIRQQYPELKGQARVATPIQYIKFSEAESLDQKTCVQSAASFSQLP